MKAAVFYGKHDIRVEEYPMPQVGSHDVLIRVMACGVCGTDMHIFEGDKGAAEVVPPTILGHEFAGIVTQVGENVTAAKVGDRVCVDPNCYCGTCEFCRKGDVHFCEHMIGYGTTKNGGFAEYCAVNERQVYKLADHISFEEGAMAEPLACCLHGIDQCDIQSGSSVLVIGGGMIGQLMVQLAKLSGAGQVALIEPEPKKREQALALGADHAFDPKTKDIPAQLRRCGIGNLNTIIECVGKTATLAQAIELAGNRATVMAFGLTKPDDILEIKPFLLFQKEISLKTSYINPLTQPRAVSLINNRRVDVRSVMQPSVELSQLTDILSNPSRRVNGKCVIRCDL